MVLQKWMSSCLRRILLKDNSDLDEIQNVDGSSTSADLSDFEAVLAPYGSFPRNDVTKATFDCGTRWGAMLERRQQLRRWRNSSSVRICPCRRPAALRPPTSPATSPGDGRTSTHLEVVQPVHTHPRRRRSRRDDADYDFFGSLNHHHHNHLFAR